MFFLKKIFKLSSIILISFFFISTLIYFLLVYKPQNIVVIANKVVAKNYSIEYKAIASEHKFLSPILILNNVVIKDIENKELIKVEEINLGIKILKSILLRHVSFDDLIFKNIQFLENINSENNSSSFKFEVNNIYISRDDFTFSSKETYINNKNGNLSIFSSNGYLNQIPFEEFSLFKSIEFPHYYYSGTFKLNEEVIERGELVDLSQFLDKKINLNIESKGYYYPKLNKTLSINKYTFVDSELVTQSNYEINGINSVLYTNIDNKLSGIFSSEIADQKITGSILSENLNITLRSKVIIDMNDINNYGQYLDLSGKEEFLVKMTIDDKVSLELTSDLQNTLIRSNLDDLRKDVSSNLKTTIKISDMSQPTYYVENNKFKAFIGNENNGYFSLGNEFNNDLKNIETNDGFYIFLELDELNIETLFSENQFESNTNLKLIKLKIDKLNIFDNAYLDQYFEINFLANETYANFSSKNLNGSINIDSSGFIRIDVFDSEFKLKGLNSLYSNNAAQINNINLRFVGKNIETFDDKFQNIDFYLLKNKRITTFDNINILSKSFNIKPTKENEKAYISYNNTNNLYKIRGSYEINDKNSLISEFINYNFGYLYTDLNIQWAGLKELKDLEGKIQFKIKDFESKTSLPDSAFLRALKILNLNSIIGNLTNDLNLDSSNLIINRAEGDLYIGKNRALITKPIKLETAEAKMNWSGDITKDKNGLLEELNLDLEMRLKVSENIPWYAAIFGGIPALAGGLVIENIIDERLDDVSTFQFDITGSISNPEITRLDRL